VGAHYEKDVTGNVATSYYSAGGQRIAMRVRTNSTNVVYYLHPDHLGSTSLATCGSGSACGGNGAAIPNSRTWYKPYGELRAGGSTLPTDYTYTGQRTEVGVGLMDYRARWYSPALGRFVSGDTVVPGAASGAGGGLATIGYDQHTRLTPLTVGFHESQFLTILNTENRELLQFGPPMMWSDKVRQEHVAPMGPANPQVLNRYAYCLGNPLRYVDPTGRYWIEIGHREYTLEELRHLRNEMANAQSALVWMAGGQAALGLLSGTIGSIPEPASPALITLGVTLELMAGINTIEAEQLDDLVDYLDDVIEEAESNEVDAVTLIVSRVKGEGPWFNLATVITSDLTPTTGNYMWGTSAWVIKTAALTWRSR